MDTRAIVDAVVSHALTLGVFDSVSGHEPETPPGTGVHAAFWVQRIRPVPRRSGLGETSILLVLNGQLYLSVDANPGDEIELNMVDATDVFMDAVTGDYSLGGAIAEVDLLGAYGVPFEAEAGYARFGASSGATSGEVTKRVMRITIPCVINDAWTQTA